MLTKFQKVKESILITILNVLLPTVDILTDLISITKLYTVTETHIDCDERSEVITHLSDFDDDDNLISIQAWYEGRRKCLENSSSSESTFNSHPIWATSLLVPFLLSYLVTWFIWWSVDKSKTITWIAPLLSVYPQVQAIKVIFHIWANPREGLARKKVLQRDAFEGETYLEAIPITVILTFIYHSAMWSDNGDAEPPILSLIGSDAKFFFVSYATSLLTASFGLAKALKTGPC